MKVTIKFIPNPTMKSFCMYGDQQDFIRKVKQERRLILDVSPNTKTTVHISLQLGDYLFSINRRAIQRLKYLERVEHSMADYTLVRKAYLKILKNQGLTAIIDHAAQVIQDYLGIDDYITLEVRVTRPIIDIKRNQTAPDPVLDLWASTTGEQIEYVPNLDPAKVPEPQTA